MLLIIATLLIAWDYVALFTPLAPKLSRWVDRIVLKRSLFAVCASIISLMIMGFVVWALSTALPLWLAITVAMVHYTLAGVITLHRELLSILD